MTPVELGLAGLVLAVAVGTGTVAHELSHALILRALAIPHDLEWLPDSDEVSVLAVGVSGRLAAVTPRAPAPDLPPWGLRVAALAPLTLALPLALVPLGILPDPVASGNIYLIAATIGWLACALPSPQDFSLVWYAERAITEYTERDV